MKIGPLLNDSILVVDEAHNILNLCEDSKTKSIDYKNIIDEIKRLNDEKNTNNKEKKEDKNKKENMKNKEKKEHKNKKENINYKEKKEYEIKIEEYRGNILEYLEILQKGMFRFYEEKKKHLSKIKPYCLIDKKDLLSIFNVEIYDIIRLVINKYLELISKEHKADKKLEKIRSFIWLLNHIKNEVNDDYMFSLSLIPKKRKEKNKNILNFRINIYCFNPSIEFKQILSLKPYRIILTSGTLSPFSFFESQLDHCFNVKYQGNHVIGQDSFIFKFITNYSLPLVNPTKKVNHRFYFTYDAKNLDFQYKALGYLLNDLCSVTPGGILIFFSSYEKIDNCLSVWKNEGLYDKINSVKNIFKEKEKGKVLEDPLNSFKQNINNGLGGIFISVFRGKISEGINFNHNLARVLINIGIPFINKNNEKYGLKEQFFEKKNKDFDQWIKNDAIFAMNQACGRLLRDKTDYGVILNVDLRNERHISLFSGWLKNSGPKCVTYKCDLNEKYEVNVNNNKFIQEIDSFFKRMSQNNEISN